MGVPEALRSRGETGRPEPASAWRTLLASLPGLAPFSSLTRRILALNVVALAVLVGGVLYLNQFRAGLIDQRIHALLIHGEIIASAIAEVATSGPEDRSVDPWIAHRILLRLIGPTNTHARLFNDNGHLVIDSEALRPSRAAPAPRSRTAPDSGLGGLIARAYDTLLRHLPMEHPPLYTEPRNERADAYPEVMAAYNGLRSSAVRMTEQDELIVSVAVPVHNGMRILGVLLLSTEAGDIDEIVRAERVAILEVFLVALFVTTSLSLLLAGTIARPIRRLAEAADVVRAGRAGSAAIPDFTHRGDEVGELSGALREMTEALQRRIEAIEHFAADVAHELRNPLTSLRSAVESLQRTRNPQHQERLLAIIAEDVQRLDRLITDISDASRLDAELSRAEAGAVDMAMLLETLIEVTRATLGANGPRFTLALDAGGVNRRPFVVRGIEGRLGQIMRNLLDNAISFSPPGGEVRLAARRRGSWLIVTVEDEGPGIAENDLERIFERFYSARPGDEPFGRHSGLGLSISRQIAEAHGGALWAENRYDVAGRVCGARFVLRLPA